MGLFFTFGGPRGLFLGFGVGFKIVLASTHIVEQFSFSMILCILTFEFDLILRVVLSFWGPNGLFLGVGVGLKHCFRSTPVV